MKELWSKLRKLKNNITREKNDKKLTVKNYTNIKYKDVSIFHEENILMSFCLTATFEKLSDLRTAFDKEDCFLNRYYKGMLTKLKNEINRIKDKYKIEDYHKTKVKVQIIEEVAQIIDSFYAEEMLAGNSVLFLGDYWELYKTFAEIATYFAVIKKSEYQIKSISLREGLMKLYNNFIPLKKMWIKK